MPRLPRYLAERRRGCKPADTGIEECHGDLALIGQYWDHHSEKTLRGVIRAFGLEDRLRAARRRQS